MIQIPLWKWGCVNLNNAVFDESFCSNKFVIWCIINDINDSGFSGNCLWGPVEVAFFKSESSKFVVSSSDSDSSDSWLVVDEFSIGDRSGFLESSLLFVNWHSASSWSSFMSWISWDTHWLFLSQNYDYKIFQFF